MRHCYFELRPGVWRASGSNDNYALVLLEVPQPTSSISGYNLISFWNFGRIEVKKYNFSSRTYEKLLKLRAKERGNESLKKDANLYR